MDRINPMYGQMPIMITNLVRPFIPSIKEAIQMADDMREAYKNYTRNKWVQEIKTNHRRNKRARRRCEKKGY